MALGRLIVVSGHVVAIIAGVANSEASIMRLSFRRQPSPFLFAAALMPALVHCAASETLPADQLIGGLWGGESYLKATHAAALSYGASTALSADGNLLVIAAPMQSSDSALFAAGAAYVYARQGASWKQTAQLSASSAEAGGAFGSSIALAADGRTLIVGAPGEQMRKGAVYVFSLEAAGWQPKARLQASNGQAGDQFGSSVAIASNTGLVAVGAMYEDSSETGTRALGGDDQLKDAGAVYLFDRQGSSWTQQPYLLKANSTNPDAHFGGSVALSADGATLAVGSAGESSVERTINGYYYAAKIRADSGAVHVYAHRAGVWTTEAFIKAENADNNDAFGASVSLSADGNELAVGAPFESSSATLINGSRNNNDAADAGAVYTYTRRATTWSQNDYIKASNARSGARFGSSVTLSANGLVLAVGAIWENSATRGPSAIPAGRPPNGERSSGEGAVYVFDRQKADWNWSPKQFLKATNADKGDLFGVSVALSSTGSALAVGAIGEASGGLATPADNSKPNSGAAYVYRR